MKPFLHRKLFILLGLIVICFSTHAEVNSEIKQLQLEWAQIKYTLDRKEHETAWHN